MLLVEYTLLDNLEVINENTTGGAKKLKLRGRFQKCDEQNNNGRVYPRKILEGQVQAIQEKIKDRSLVGALDHPANDAIHLSQASHLITGLSVDKTGDVIGECEILSTPNGKIVESLINDGVKIGISSRGVGSVSESTKGKVVNEDFKLITFDLVSDPSTKGAFPELTESMRENSERAQAIVSQHKKDRVLMTVLESKIKEALKGKQKKLDKNKNNKLDAEDFKMLRGEKGDDSMDEKSFPDLSGDGKVTMKDILMGRGVIKGKKKKGEEKRKDETGPDAKRNKEAMRDFYASQSDVGSVRSGRKSFRQKMAAKAPLKSRAQAEIDAKKRFARQPTAQQAGMNASTEIFGQKVVEAYRNLVRKDEARMSDRDIDRQKRMRSGAYDDRTDRDADMSTAGARQTARVIRKKAGKSRARYIAQFKDQYKSDN